MSSPLFEWNRHRESVSKSKSYESNRTKNTERTKIPVRYVCMYAVAVAAAAAAVIIVIVLLLGGSSRCGVRVRVRGWLFYSNGVGVDVGVGADVGVGKANEK